MRKHRTDQQLIQQLLKGGNSLEEGMTYLYHESGYKEAIQRFFSRKQEREEAIEDIFQEGICQLIMNIRANKFKQESSLKTYFMGICRNIWLAQLKQQARQQGLKQSLLLEIDKPNASTPSYVEQSKLLSQLLLQIGVDCKTVLSLWALDYSMEEIVVETSYKSVSVVSKKKHLCLKKLKVFLKNNPSLREQLIELM